MADKGGQPAADPKPERKPTFQFEVGESNGQKNQIEIEETTKGTVTTELKAQSSQPTHETQQKSPTHNRSAAAKPATTPADFAAKQQAHDQSLERQMADGLSPQTAEPSQSEGQNPLESAANAGKLNQAQGDQFQNQFNQGPQESIADAANSGKLNQQQGDDFKKEFDKKDSKPAAGDQSPKPGEPQQPLDAKLANQPGGKGLGGTPKAKEATSDIPAKTGGGFRNRLNDFRMGQNFGLKMDVKKLFSKRVVGLLLKNPWVLAGIAAVIIAVILGVVAITIIACTASGSCTGSTPRANANGVTNQDDVLILLAKTNDPAARRKLLRDHGPQILERLGALRDTPSIKNGANGPAKVAAINALIKVINDDLPTLASIDPTSENHDKVADARKRVQKAYNDYLQVVGGTFPLVTAYADFANSVIGKDAYKREPTGAFFDWRSISQWRRNAGLHLGYDIAAPAGTPVVAGWDGELIDVIPWTDVEFGIAVTHEEIDGKKYTPTYGHVIPAFDKSEKKKIHIVVIRDGQPTTVRVGERIQKSDILAKIAKDHVDIKWKDSVGSYADWGDPRLFAPVTPKASQP